MTHLQDIFTRWRQGDYDAYHDASAQLWTARYGSATRYLQQFPSVDSSLAKTLASDAYSRTLEILDLQISGGGMLTTLARVEKDDLTDPACLCARLRTATDPFSTYLRALLSPPTLHMLQHVDGSSAPSDELILSIIEAMNAALADPDLPHPQPVTPGDLPEEV
jgi:hypothetical protein